MTARFAGGLAAPGGGVRPHLRRRRDEVRPRIEAAGAAVHEEGMEPSRTGPSPLHDERLDAVQTAVLETGARSVIDLGCGDGALLMRLARSGAVVRLLGLDPDEAALARLRDRLRDAPAQVRARVELVRGSMLDARAVPPGFDCATLVETIEHLPPDRLSALEATLFRSARPGAVVVTTPNAEFNPLLGTPRGRFRHPDHRFEWDRAQFRRWSRGVAERQDYRVAFRDIGGRHAALGGASQMAMFRRAVAEGRA